MTWGWDFEKLKDMLSRPVKRPRYVVTDDLEDFLQRMEGIAKRGLQQDASNLKCLEILSSIHDVRNGMDPFEAFTILKEFHNYDSSI